MTDAQNRVLTDTDIDEKINIDEAVPANREPWISVVYPGTFDFPESRFHEETGPVNFTPNRDHSPLLPFGDATVP